MLLRKVPNLKVKHLNEPAFCDLLEYATLKDECIILKNGSLLQIYEIFPEDNNLKNEDELNHLRSYMDKCLLKLDGHWSINCDVLRLKSEHYYPFFQGQNKAALFFDKERIKAFKNKPYYESKFYLSLCYTGKNRAQRAVSSLFLKQMEASISKKELTLKVISDFRAQTKVISESLKACFDLKLLSVKKDFYLNSHEALSFIKYCICGKKTPVAIPYNNCYLDCLISNDDFVSGLTPKIGNKYIACIAIDGLPSESKFLILDKLSTLDFEYRFHTRFICMDALASRFSLEKYKRLWQQKRKGILAQIFNQNSSDYNAFAQEQLEDINKAQKLLDDGSEIFGRYTALILILDEDFKNLEIKALKAVHAIESLGFGARIETVNANEAYLGSLPGHNFYNVRRNLISSKILSDLLPLNAPNLGEKYSPNPLFGTKASALMQSYSQTLDPVFINLHDKDLGNSLVVGPPGTGKSVLLGQIMLNLLRYKDMQIFCFDKGYSFYGLGKACEANNINLSKNLCFCPLEFLETQEDLSFAEDFLETIFTLNEIELNTENRVEISDALKILQTNSKDKRTITDFSLMLSSRSLKEALLDYKIGQKAGFFDSESNIDLNNPFTIFECAEVFEYPKRFLIPLLKHIFNLIKRKFTGSTPGAIVLDEAWIMLKHNLFAKELLTWFKTLRKSNVSVILATQSLCDLEKSEIFETLLDCVKTRFFLPNPDAVSKPLIEAYLHFGLRESEILRISQGIKKRDLFLQKPDLFLNILNLIENKELRLLTQASAQSVPYIDKLLEKYGPTFYKEEF